MPPYPDEQLPTEQWSLQEISALAGDFLDPDDSLVEGFVELMLAGRRLTLNGPRRINIDVHKDCIDPATLDDITITRDFDSIIGVTTNLPFSNAISVYPVPNFRDCVNKPVHITKEIQLPVCDHFIWSSLRLAFNKHQGWPASRMVPLHLIPNICFAKDNMRQKTCIMFPRMYTGREARVLTAEEMRTMYDTCIRPAIHEVLPANISHWPLTYNAEWTRGTSTRGLHKFSTIDLPERAIAPIATALRNRLEQHPMFQQSFFYHEWRGIKGRTLHDPSDNDACDEALNCAWSGIDMDEMYIEEGENEWYVDVALEVHSPNLVLQWREDSHAALLHHVLPTAPWERVDNIPNTTAFNNDISALLYQLAGFRVEVPAVGRPDNVRYVNVYTTDKSATYQLHQGAYSRHKPSDLLPNKITKLLKDVGLLAQLYYQCAGYREDDEEGVCQEGAARLEIRVKVVPGEISDVLRDIPRDLINTSIVGFNAYEWW